MRFRWTAVLGASGFVISSAIVIWVRLGSPVGLYSWMRYFGLLGQWLGSLVLAATGDEVPGLLEIIIAEAIFVLGSGLQWAALGLVVDYLKSRTKDHAGG